MSLRSHPMTAGDSCDIPPGFSYIRLPPGATKGSTRRACSWAGLSWNQHMDGSNADSWARQEQWGRDRPFCKSSDHSKWSSSSLWPHSLTSKDRVQQTLPFHTVPERGREDRKVWLELSQLSGGAAGTRPKGHPKMAY